jgi:hypothetical protein
MSILKKGLRGFTFDDMLMICVKRGSVDIAECIQRLKKLKTRKVKR